MSPAVNDAPVELIHFYSYATGVSLELPVGWERIAEDEASASYAVLDNDDITPVPGTQLQVRTLGRYDATPAAERQARVEALVAGLLERGLGRGGELVGRGERVVDDERVLSVTTRDAEGIWVLAAAVATEDRLLSVTGLARDEAVLAALEAGVDSIRFVEL